MPRLRPLLESVHIFTLAIWGGSLAFTAVTAAVAFPTMRKLDPRLPEFAAYEGEHWRIAAGHIANRLFLINDMVQLAGVLVTLLTFGLLLLTTKRAAAGVLWPYVLRAVLLSAASILVAYQLFILAPRMQTNLQAFWDAARAGDAARAEALRSAFEVDHPTASNVLVATGVCVLLSLLTAAWSAAASPTTPAGELESPALLRKR